MPHFQKFNTLSNLIYLSCSGVSFSLINEMNRRKRNLGRERRLNIGDNVSWLGGPNEFRDNRYGKILSIKHGVATIDDYRSAGKTRQVPLKILKKK